MQQSQTSQFEIILADGAVTPERANKDDAGLDLFAHGTHVFESNEAKPVPTGVHINMPLDYLAWIVPRSGRSMKRPFIIPNAPGLIDPGYQGEIMIPHLNLSIGRAVVEPAEKIAQLVFSPVHRPDPRIVHQFTSSTQRGAKGFGSSDQ